MPNTTKRDLVIELSNQSGQKQADVERMMDMLVTTMARHMSDGSHITLRGFGTFEVRVAKGKIGRNPNRPGSEVRIPDRCVIRFRPGRELKEKVAQVPVERVQEIRRDDNGA